MDETDNSFLRVISGKLDSDNHTAISDAVKQLTKEFAKQNEMMLSEFRKYEILFNHEFKEKVINYQLTPAEEEEYRELSAEFLKRIDPYKPIILIDDATGKKFPPIPPLYRRLTAGSNPDYNKITSEIMAEYSDVMQHDDGNPVGVSAYQQNQVMQKIANTLLACETTEQIHKESKAHKEMEEKFLAEYNKDSSSDTTQVNSNNANKNEEDKCDISTSGDDFDFDL